MAGVVLPWIWPTSSSSAALRIKSARDITQSMPFYRNAVTAEVKRVDPTDWARGAMGVGSALQVRALWAQSCPDVQESLKQFTSARPIVEMSDGGDNLALLDNKVRVAEQMRTKFCR
ncbi:hypothetical protein [Sphingobium sp. B12D2B]|uniref:hypothetical protein n=1 Tax=Sphingobium sp. B12D2B TaxID=2940577 RepID=UPI002224D451|nr:hypothetical protein [Sphingobium sp. B12D2B]MCW2349151.1 hypothetical protein [Sphingobium sp. B12D2B]